MNVSWRHTLAAGTAVALASTLGLAFAGGTGGQSGTVPGVTIGAATNPNTSACCDGGNHVITPPGVSVPGPNLVYTPGSAKVGSQYIVGGYEAEASYSGWVGVDCLRNAIADRQRQFQSLVDRSRLKRSENI